MNADLMRINARVSKIQGDCRNSGSKFFQDKDFRTQEIERVDAAINELRAQHIGQDLSDITAMKASWDRFKSNISEVYLLDDVKSRITSLRSRLAPPVPSAGTVAADEESDLQATMDVDEQEKADRLETQKERLSQDKPNLFKAISSLAGSIVDGKYGEVIKAACMEQHPSVVYKDAFLRLVMIKQSMNEPIPHTQQELEWGIPEEAFESLRALKEEIKKISQEERLSLLQKISNAEEEIPLTENEKKLFGYLNDAVNFLKITKDEELIYPQLLCEKVEELEKVSKHYKMALRKAQTLTSPLKRGQLLAKTISTLRSTQPKLFFDAIDKALENLLGMQDREAAQPVVNSILQFLQEELEKNPQIIASFSQHSTLCKYLCSGLQGNDLHLDSRLARFCILLIPALFEQDRALALKLTQKVLEFAGSIQEKFVLPFELAQTLITYEPSLVSRLLPYLSRRDSVQCLIQQIHSARESGATAPDLFEECKLEAQMFMQEMLFDYLDEPSKANADQTKIKIRQLLQYFRSELQEFLLGKSPTEIEFDLCRRCLGDPLSAMMLIPELVNLGKKYRALLIARDFIKIWNPSADKTIWKELSYALLKASGLKWPALDTWTFGPLLESSTPGSHPLDPDFTALYLELIRSLPDPSVCIGNVIDFSMALDTLAVEFRNDSYSFFSSQVTELLQEILSKTFKDRDSIADPIRKVKTLSRLTIGFSLIGEIDKIIPVARRALDEILLSDFPEEPFVPMLKMLTNNLITSIKIIHKKPGSDAPEIEPLKAELVDLEFETIRGMPDVEDRIEALLDIPDHLEVEFHEDDDFYVEVSLRAMDQALTEITVWDASGELINEKIQTLNDLLDTAAPLSERLALLINIQIEAAQMSLTAYRHIQNELDRLEREDEVDPTMKVEKCIELLKEAPDSNTRSRVVTIYANSIDRIESPRQEELREAMGVALSNSNSPFDEDDSDEDWS